MDNGIRRNGCFIKRTTFVMLERNASKSMLTLLESRYTREGTTLVMLTKLLI